VGGESGKPWDLGGKALVAGAMETFGLYEKNQSEPEPDRPRPSSTSGSTAVTTSFKATNILAMAASRLGTAGTAAGQVIHTEYP
jgi:hypothetical protein